MTKEIKQEPKPRIKVVDSNEPGIIREKLLELGWEQRRGAESADYWFFDIDYKKVGIQRKEVNDFMASLGDKLARQLEEMLDHYDTVILLLEGNWRNVAGKNILTDRGISYNTWAMAWNFIRSQQHKGVTLELTTSMGHTIQRVNELYAWYQKGMHSGGMSHKTFIDDRIMAFPRGCRGKTAELVLAMFKSLVCVGNASVEDLQNVSGVGSKKAQNIYDHFNTWRGEKPPSVEEYREQQEAVVVKEQKEIEQGRLL